ncbi:hypothetical protein LOZ12_001027 [Ophidiomyces ophidiicola]|uniref:Uncharacterized protein n=1 Tax=Ophidiomyces ophidiicola TaxID=1387563 RepID=A0ACB8V4I8_9EURO|nr:hypothetical protein LOZ64_001470 [Ophidiomyces ophidiicola]KAI1948912.1 hypothetical protein LOZ62_002424 [Ophidiomyces ophidiicola]KAI1960913.1 hypothetical protein LOZ56_006785 [Ophidiomyces ophidiicola]KAI1968375.1 hypothetical protein LOZ59_000229 [Ophidiomyces ophidiicola]KAI2021938.1 hypothetical protein LOZ46_002070 [Ophidiomyces ophidiicola]
MRALLLLLPPLLLLLLRAGAAVDEPTPGDDDDDAAEPVLFVDALLGSIGGGNVFAGASLPYGLAKAVADIHVDGAATPAAFTPDGSRVTGFSHAHDAGAAGRPSLGWFPLFPQLCAAGADLARCRFTRAARAMHYLNDSVVPAPGFFSLALENDIVAEMTVSAHAVLYRFHLPLWNDSRPRDIAAAADAPVVLLDLSDLPGSRQSAWVAVDRRSGRIATNATFRPSYGAGEYVAHACVDFAGAAVAHTGVYLDQRAAEHPATLHVPRGAGPHVVEAGAWVSFVPANETVLAARVGLSLVSVDQACRNADREIPRPWDFNDVWTRAERAWGDKMRPLHVEPGDVSDGLLRIFWSAVYRSMISPQDYTSENPRWASAEPYFDSFSCLWDSFRTQLPLLAILDPAALARMIRSLLDTYLHEGWLPDCRTALSPGFSRGGSSADIVLTDAYLKNVSEGIDWNVAFDAMVKNAEQEPYDWSTKGRGGLMSWKALDYIPALDFDYIGFGANSRSISRTLEYSYNDYCIATLAQKLRKEPALFHKYLKRADNWRNLHREDQNSTVDGEDSGFRGFLQPRYANGSWGFQDPTRCSLLDEPCSLTVNPQETFEGSIWEYQFFVPHNIANLVHLYGGPDNFTARLDMLHDLDLADMGSAPALLTPFLYHYAGRPALSALRIHSYIPSRFNSSRNGLPGSDDGAALAAFTVFAMMGLFPNAGQDVYLITPPFFAAVHLTHPLTNRTATIRSRNFDPRYRALCIQYATLNGKPYTKNWIGHDFFTQGMTLELTLGEEETDWGTKPEDLPPSMNIASMPLV